MNGTGAVVGRLKIDTGVPGFGELMALLAEHGGDPKSVPVAIEMDKNLIVAAMQAASMTVYAINPRGRSPATVTGIARPARAMQRFWRTSCGRTEKWTGRFQRSRR